MKKDVSSQKPNILDYATIEAVCDGVPVYSFNHLIYLHGQSPDFYPDAIFQEKNDHPVSKINLKKTWELKNNFFGICHEMTPRTRENDSQPFLPIHLIDGDPETIWSSFECLAPTASKEWIRIDLPMEGMISSVTLTCQKQYMGRTKGGRMRPTWEIGRSLPKELTIKVSKDAWHWDTMYECGDLFESVKETKTNRMRIVSNATARGYVLGESKDPDCVTIEFSEPVPAKQILIEGMEFLKKGYQGYIFSISGVEILDPGGRNVALVSNGAGVTVSSTSDAHNSDRYSANALWGPLLYDVGTKWVKVGSDNGSLLWCFTEHEKGILKVDEEADAAITEAVNNGMKLILTLDFLGNWIYEDPPRKTDWQRARYSELNESYMCGISLASDNPEMYEAYLRYIEYMAEHFKDRVEYFEVGNEWHGWKDNLNWYKNIIFEPTYDRIKKVAPDAKVSLCGVGGYNPEDVICCLGPGTTANEGVLSIFGRALLTVKDANWQNVSVGMDVNCVAETGIVFRAKDKDNFLAAIYDPIREEIYVTECVGHHWYDRRDVLSYYEHKGTVSAGGLSVKVRMEASISDNKVVLKVSDDNLAYTTECIVENVAPEGNVGLFTYPGETKAEFSNFNVISDTGELIFSGSFNAEDDLEEIWTIDWNHWGDMNKPIAALRVDAVGWHPLAHPDREYFESVRVVREKCRKLGFDGQYLINEIYAGAAYPPGPRQPGEPISDAWYDMWQFWLSDIQEAKYFIRSMVGHGSLNMEVGPCHLAFTGFPHPQATCRTTVASHVLAPSQPKPTHYCIRNISTAMDNFYEANFPVSFTSDEDIMYFTLENVDKNELMIATFLDVNYTDDVQMKKTDIHVKEMNIKSAWGIDVFNGTEQELVIESSNEETIIPHILIKDYPQLIILKK